jgi:signal transduction histidine kinase
MRLVPKLSIGYAALGVALIAGFGAWITWRESGHLRDQASREIALLGDALAVAAENALRDAQAQDIDETLARLERSRPDSDIAVMTTQGRVEAESFPGVGVPEPSADLLRAALADGIARTIVESGGDVPRILRVVPLRDDDGTPLGALLVARPLTEVQRNIEAARFEVALGALAFALAALVMSPLLSRRMVGLPMAANLRGVDQARAGPITTALPVERGDELGEIARALGALADDLERARKAARDQQALKEAAQRSLVSADKLAAIGQLAATFAHEVGSPLQVLIGQADALRESPGLPEGARARLEKVSGQLRRLTSMVEELLGLVRREARPRSRIDAIPPIREVVELFELQAERRKIALSFHASPESARLDASASGLQQVMFNLLNNAFEGIGDRPGTISVRVRLLADSGRADGSPSPSLRVQVEDDGCGIPEAVIDKVLSPFFSTRRDHRGTGLGLAVVRAVVAEHGGALAIASTSGRGTTVTFDLPLPSESAP